ncbi:hypothetical protein TRVL_06861 [Trypanosoma vivax]|nr:hypothetical protein TRVL_06861 [Trypanosoma vivax]
MQRGRWHRQRHILQTTTSTSNRFAIAKLFSSATIYCCKQGGARQRMAMRPLAGTAVLVPQTLLAAEVTGPECHDVGLACCMHERDRSRFRCHVAVASASSQCSSRFFSVADHRVCLSWFCMQSQLC